MSNIIAQLRGGNDRPESEVGALTGRMIWLRYDEVSGGIVAGDQGGFILTRHELKSMVDGINTFLDYYSDEAIKEYNDEKLNPARSTGPSVPNEVKPRKGWIYIIQGQGNQFKIGFTGRKPSDRLAEFTPKLPFKTILIHTMASDDVLLLERTLHARFEDKRINGEWFELSGADVEWLRGVK